jgi:hypothetical protein
MDIIDNELISWSYTKFIFIGLFIFIFFRIIRFATPAISPERSKRKKLYRFQPFIEMFSWMAYIIWAIQVFANKSTLYSIGLFVLALLFVLLITWYMLRDFISGVIFRFSQLVSRNEVIKIHGFQGRIIEYRPLALEIETDTSERILIPYSAILSQTIIKAHPAERILNYTFTVNTDKNLSLTSTIRKIREAIYNLP